MALGFPITQVDMNSRVGQLAVAVRDVLTIDVPKVKATVDGMNDAHTFAPMSVLYVVDPAAAHKFYVADESGRFVGQ